MVRAAVQLDGASIPQLVRRARLRWDEARKTHLLLVPEGVLTLTETAADILRRCDGQRSVDVITDELAEVYGAPREELVADVIALLARLADRGYVTEGSR